MRYAIYFTPGPRDPLTVTASGWLGRDVHAPATLYPAHDFSGLLQSPRRYGFHATMKAPFRLRDGKTEAQLLKAFDRFCKTREPVEIDALALARLGQFFALVPTSPEPALNALAAQTVREFDPFRAPLTAEDRARRNPDQLTEEQCAMLDDWGYPYVFDEFRFHMTLTGPVPVKRARAVETELADQFSDHIGQPLVLSGLSLFVEHETGQPFELLTTADLGAAHHMKAMT